MAKESTQHKLDRVRKPRVQITYDVELNGAMKMTELPFVVGVMGDFSGKPDQPLPQLKDRKFVEIDRDNFDKVLSGCKPRLVMSVDDKLTGRKDAKLQVELKFSSMDDFSPENIAKQVEPMRKLLEQRERLKSLLSQVDGNDKGFDALQKILDNAEDREKLAKELGISPSAPEGGSN